MPAVITLLNLRGTKESGLALVVPTCLFIATLSFILATGAWAAWASDGHPQPVVPLPAPSGAAEGLAVWRKPFNSGTLSVPC